jgi:hypothetical protein
LLCRLLLLLLLLYLHREGTAACGAASSCYSLINPVYAQPQLCDVSVRLVQQLQPIPAVQHSHVRGLLLLIPRCCRCSQLY